MLEIRVKCLEYAYHGQYLIRQIAKEAVLPSADREVFLTL